MAFEISPEIEVHRDDEGRIVLLRHPRSPYTPQRASLTEPSATDLADRYVAEVAPLYGLHTDTLDGGDPALRRDVQKSVMDSTVVAYQEVVRGLPIWNAVLEVRLAGDPPRVVSSSSTLHLDIDLDAQPRNGSAEFMAEDTTAVGAMLGIDPATNPEFRINQTRLLVYQYDPAERFDPAATTSVGGEQAGYGPPVLPLAPVPPEIVSGRHYVVHEVLFNHSLPRWGLLHWRAFIEPRQQTVLYLRAFVAAQHAWVFRSDPVSMSGKPMDGGTPAADLDPLRARVPLLGLDPPAGGRQALSGEFIALADTDLPTVPAPSEPAPFDFSYSAVNDDFAAACAYYNYDRLYRLVQGMGFTIAQYFDGTAFPVPTDHQGFGNQVNAAAHGNAAGNGMGRYRNGLARAGFSVGIAADWRVVLHEFGHALLWDHVNSPNFGFCHSAGDTLAVILNDADSRAPDRYVTFPFSAAITRRHDRDVADGWAWGGLRDDRQYGSEQILSTLLFRVYRVTGGDDADTGVRRFAGRYLAYLIIRAIGTLTVTSTDPRVLATALMDADDNTVDFEGHAGGAWHKVIRWSFERQGLYQPPGAPVPVQQPGAPPAVDVYVDDGRGGEYLPYLPDFTGSSDVWNRWVADGGAEHQQPMPGQTNHLYVRVGNRGTQQATGVRVRVYQGAPESRLVWPADWQLASPEQQTGPIAPHGRTVVGPFAWNPAAQPGQAVLASVSATGDISNAETVNGAIPHWRLVPFDNNLALRTMTAPQAAAVSLLTDDEPSDQPWRGLFL